MDAIEERLAQLEEKLREQERALKEQVIARRKSQELREERARDTRREILVGAAILSAIKLGEWPRDKLMALLDLKLLRNVDRALFRLPPLELSEQLEREELEAATMTDEAGNNPNPNPSTL